MSEATRPRNVVPIFGSLQVEFESTMPLNEAVKRLSKAVFSTSSNLITAEIAVGSVSVKQVCIQRGGPLAGDIFRPMFRGEFQEKADRVFLVGRFVTPLVTRVFLALGTAFLTFWTLLAAASSGLAPMLWFGPSMFVTLVVFAHFCRWLHRGDVAWLSHAIRHAIG